MRRYPVISLQISATSIPRMLGALATAIAEHARVAVHVCTAHTTLEAHADGALANAINQADYAVPDGMPLVWLGRLRRLEVDRCYGPDLMHATCRDGLARGYRHYLYGSTPETLERLSCTLQEQHPGIILAGAYSPPFRPLTEIEEQEMLDRINAARPDIVWIGLGTPKQDLWLARFRPRLSVPVLVAVGAAFNFHAGTLKQAPRWMMRAGLEWLFRLCSEPRRLWRRYLVGNAQFVLLSLWQALRGGTMLPPRKGEDE